MSDENIFAFSRTEIGVASTSIYNATAYFIDNFNFIGKINLINDYESKIITLLDLPSLLNDVLEKENELRDIASKIYNAKDVLYISEVWVMV